MSNLPIPLVLEDEAADLPAGLLEVTHILHLGPGLQEVVALHELTE